MKSRRIKMAFVPMAVLLFLGLSGFAKADGNAPKERTVRVTGEGKVTAVPDQAEMEFTVQEEGAQLKDASARVRTKMKKIFGVIQSFGISDKDFQTVSYTIQPKYKYDKNGNETQRIGYIVTNRVHVNLKDLDKTGDLLESITEADVTQVDGPNFGFSDPTKLQIAALKAAVADAQAKAEALAQASGAELGKVFSISQSGANMPVRPMLAEAPMAMANAGVPIAKGQNEVTAQVEVVYLLK